MPDEASQNPNCMFHTIMFDQIYTANNCYYISMSCDLIDENIFSILIRNRFLIFFLNNLFMFKNKKFISV